MLSCWTSRRFLFIVSDMMGCGFLSRLDLFGTNERKNERTKERTNELFVFLFLVGVEVVEMGLQV